MKGKIVLGLILLVLLLGCTSAPSKDTNQSIDQNDTNVMVPPIDTNVDQNQVKNPPIDMNVDQNSSDQNISDQNVTVPAGITAAELAVHKTQSDCWVGFQGKAYDLTAWLPKHPGSAEAIAPYCGTSKEFEDAFTAQHGERMIGRMDQEGVLKGDLAP